MNYILLTTILIIIIVPLYLAETRQISVSIWRRGKNLQVVSPLCVKEGLGWAYHNETQSCQKIGEQGPCEELMKFSKNSTSPSYGNCVCDFYKQCGRPVVQWLETGKCYFVNDKGPCLEGQWLTMTPEKRAVCTDNICQAEETQTPSEGSKYWFAENGTCYQTQTKGYCDDENALLLFTRQDYKPTCNYGLVCGAVHVKDLPKIIKSWNLSLASPQSQSNDSSGSGKDNSETIYTSILDVKRQRTG